jgi:hypothetical protein
MAKKIRNRERLSDYADVPDYRDPNIGRNLSYTEKRNSDYKHGPAMAKGRRQFEEEEVAGKKEDNRDIFDKVLDDAPASGMYLGLLGGALGGITAISRRGRKIIDSNRGQDFTKKEVKILEKMDRRALPSMLIGGTTGGVAGALAGEKLKEKYGRKGKR